MTFYQTTDLFKTLCHTFFSFTNSLFFKTGYVTSRRNLVSLVAWHQYLHTTSRRSQENAILLYTVGAEEMPTTSHPMINA